MANGPQSSLQDPPHHGLPGTACKEVPLHQGAEGVEPGAPADRAPPPKSADSQGRCRGRALHSFGHGAPSRGDRFG